MPNRVTMEKAVRLCRQRVDMIKNQARDNDAFKALISEMYGEVYMTVAGAGGRYFEKTYSITADGSASYDEVVDHLGSVRMAHVLDDGREVPLDELMAQEERQYKGRTGDAIAFTLVDDQIFLYPKPSSGNYLLYYIPQPPDLSEYSDEQEIDVVTPDGLAFLLWGVAVKVHGELENNAQLAMVERDRYGARLLEWAQMRAFNEPRRFAGDDFDHRDASMFRDGEWWTR